MSCGPVREGGWVCKWGEDIDRLEEWVNKNGPRAVGGFFKKKKEKIRKNQAERSWTGLDGTGLLDFRTYL